MILRSELVLCPERGGGGQRVEILQLQQAGGGLVMIAPNKNFPQAAGSIGHFVRRSAVADNIAKIHDGIVRRSGREAGLQRFEIGVNVAKQEYAQ